MIRAIIVDDELACRETLCIFLKEYCEDVQIIASVESIDEAYEHIVLKKPDLVFLDISMPPSNGFELLKKFRQIQFEFIFTTAYNEYAIQAIKVSAADYLLKPIDPVELVASIEMVKSKLARNRKTVQFGKIIIHTDKGILFASSSDIIRIEALGRKVVFIMKDGRQIEVSATLNDVEGLLDGYNFMRSHRSHIINLDEIVEYIPDKYGGCVIMKDKKLVPIADRRKDDFNSLMESLRGI
jgi:two-component system LytT family response regulator